MRIERSAGVIVIRETARSTGSGQASGRRKYLLLDYGKFWDFPKGHVEKKESDLDAAARELREETGIREIEFINGFAREITYFFRAGPQLIRKTVIFFLGRTDKSRIRVSHEHEGHEWLEYDQAVERLTYASAKDVLRHAHRYLETSSTKSH
jgi:8-oxo-dGTP pyrophosphatase MutT (NUDIX family)